MRDFGNMLIVVEYDEDMMMVVDYLIDIGSGVGIYGGQVMVVGMLEEVMEDLNLLMGSYLLGKKFILLFFERRKLDGCYIEIKGVVENNLKKVNVKFLFGMFIVVIGVFGLGKSIFVNEILYKVLV